VNSTDEVSRLVLNTVQPTSKLELVIPENTLFKLSGKSPCIFTRPATPGRPEVLWKTDRTAMLSWAAPDDLFSNFALLQQYNIIVLKVFQETKEDENKVLSVELKTVQVMSVLLEVEDILPKELGKKYAAIKKQRGKFTEIDKSVRIALSNGTTFYLGNVTDMTDTSKTLLPYTEYKFQIVAVNQQGPGPASAESIVSRTEMGRPSTPGTPSAIDKSKTTLIIQWDSPTAYGAPNNPANLESDGLTRSALYYYDISQQKCAIMSNATSNATNGADCAGRHTALSLSSFVLSLSGF
jgi:hypothetical protein